MQHSDPGGATPAPRKEGGGFIRRQIARGCLRRALKLLLIVLGIALVTFGACYYMVLKGN